jgi:hypothetical protein
MPGSSIPLRLVAGLATRFPGFRHIAFSTRIAAIAAVVLFGASASADSISAAAQIALRASSTGATSSPSTSLTLPAPGGVQPGDLMLASVDVLLGGAGSIGSPAGWTLIRRDSGTTGGSASLSQALYFKLASAEEPSSYRWTFSSVTGGSGGILAFSGIDPAAPIDAHSGRYRNYPKSLIAPSVVTTARNAVLVGLYGTASRGSITVTPPSGMIERLETRTTGGTYQTTSEVAEGPMAVPASTGERIAIASERASAGIGQLVALRPDTTVTPALSPPLNTSLPTISGTATVGSTLTADQGAWSGSAPMTFANQWKRCDSTGGSCAPISGATGGAYVLTSADGGSTIRVTVTASNAVASVSATSAQSATVPAPVTPPPAPTPPPPPPPAPTPPPPPPPPPAPSPGVVWSADMETGNLTQWTKPSIVNGSTQGGSYDSGYCSRPTNGISTDVARSGRYSMKMTIDTTDRTSSGCRQFRHAESVSGNAYYYSAWFYLPTKSVATDYWNVFQIKSESPTANDPFWVIDLMPRSNGSMRLLLRWKGTVAGPYSSDTSTGTKYFDQAAAEVPVGRWFQVEAYLKQARDFSGRLTIWQDGVQLWDMVNVKTKYPDGDNRWSVNNYSDGVSPNPTALYVDDAVISTTRVGP